MQIIFTSVPNSTKLEWQILQQTVSVVAGDSVSPHPWRKMIKQFPIMGFADRIINCIVLMFCLHNKSI